MFFFLIVTLQLNGNSHSCLYQVSKFLQAMQERGFIKLKEISKGVDSIDTICFDHPELVYFLTRFFKSREDGGIDARQEKHLYSSGTE